MHTGMYHYYCTHQNVQKCFYRLKIEEKCMGLYKKQREGKIEVLLLYNIERNNFLVKKKKKQTLEKKRLDIHMPLKL